MRWGLPAFVLVAVVGLAGCQSTHSVKLVRPEKRIVSIVSLSPSTSEIIGTTNISMLLKGRTASDDYPVSIKSTPVVASIKPDYELIKMINPSLILYDAQLYNPEDVAKIKALKIDTFVLDAQNVADFEKQVYQLGDLTGSQTSMSDYVGRVEDARNSSVGSKPSTPVKIAIIIPTKGGAPLICGSKGFLNDVVTQCGGILVGPPVDNFVPVNAETFVSQNPDLIVVPTDAKSAAADEESILKNPQFQSVNAVKNHRMAALESEVVLRRGARVDKLFTNMTRAMTVKNP